MYRKTQQSHIGHCLIVLTGTQVLSVSVLRVLCLMCFYLARTAASNMFLAELLSFALPMHIYICVIFVHNVTQEILY